MIVYTTVFFVVALLYVRACESWERPPCLIPR